MLSLSPGLAFLTYFRIVVALTESRASGSIFLSCCVDPSLFQHSLHALGHPHIEHLSLQLSSPHCISELCLGSTRNNIHLVHIQCVRNKCLVATALVKYPSKGMLCLAVFMCSDFYCFNHLCHEFFIRPVTSLSTIFQKLACFFWKFWISFNSIGMFFIG